MKRKPCGRIVVGGQCAYERMKGKQRCHWHWLLAQPVDIQVGWAEQRLRRWARANPDSYTVARVPVSDWPAGERWCSGCQSFVPLFYCTGSRCKACASRAAHAGHVKKTYGITGALYDRLLRFQGGRCYICQRRPGKRRLAVDHDHKTGEVRGLLCANNENGCNRAVIANLESAADGGLAAAKRAVSYLEDPPFARLQRGEQPRTELRPIAGPPPQPPPF